MALIVAELIRLAIAAEALNELNGSRRIVDPLRPDALIEPDDVRAPTYARVQPAEPGRPPRRGSNPPRASRRR